jgi:competence protein ComEC
MKKTTLLTLIASEKITQFVSDNNDRVILWIPVVLGVGIACYFALPFEPPLIWGGLLLSFFAVAAYIANKKYFYPRAFLMCLFIALGFFVSQVKAHLVAAPVIEKEMKANIIGRVVSSSSSMDKGQRVVLDNLEIEGVEKEKIPEKIRIRLTKKSDKVHDGQIISFFCAVMPPFEPARPDGFQFSRFAWFKQLGGVGFAMSRWKEASFTQQVNTSAFDSLKISIGKIRSNMTEKIMRVLPNEKGAIAATLITGERSAVPKVIIEAYRDSGLAHLLSISGLHMSMVAGLVFLGVRLFIVFCFDGFALRHDTKKLAAIIALAVCFGYLLLSGFRVPTQRAFIMISIVFAAVLMDRQAISIRLVAWAATIVLLISPESLLTPGFHMSFAAVLALVCAYEEGAGKMRLWMRGNRDLHGYSWHRIVIAYLGGVVITDFIASSATTPFAIYHFNRFVAYTMIGNLLAAPVVGICIMPFAIISVILMPFGLERIALIPMGYGIDIVNDATLMVSSWDGASVMVPAMPIWGILLIATGFLWLCLIKGKARFAGVVAVVIGLVSPYIVPKPDILIDEKASLFAVRDEAEQLVLSSTAKNKYFAKRWLEKEGVANYESIHNWEGGWNLNDENVMRCDYGGCVYIAKGYKIAFLNDVDAVNEDCSRDDIDILVSKVPVRGHCNASYIIDRFDVWRNGAYAVWLGNEGAIKIKSVADSKGKRLWTKWKL